MNNEFTIKITFNPQTKDCRVEGPLKNKELCDLGMALAKEVMDRNRRRMIISAPAGVALPDIKSMLKNDSGKRG